MKKLRTVYVLALLSALVIIAVPISGVRAPETLLWEADVDSTGVPVTTPFLLEAGREYRIEAQGSFISCDPVFGWVVFAADAQYYTMEFDGTFPANWWLWSSSIRASPSFLQIDGMDVDWGSFSNGGITWLEGHAYTAYYVGMDAPITFSIVDPDGNYEHNYCHIHVKIYEGTLVPVGQTAFAYGGPEYAWCFRCMDFDGNGKGDFKNWGWSNGPLAPDPVYTFDIYAGAAKCDISKGTLVGTLTVDYDGSTAIVTYMMNEGWTMGMAQLYVDGDWLPRDVHGDYTVSPGQYPYKYYVEGPTHTFTVPGLSGDIYVVAHADVFGPP